ncbi:MAG: LLM class F420-dependent oxidoreductase [Solirubrobacterales bacterium]
MEASAPPRRVGLTIPLVSRPLNEQQQVVETAAALGYTDLWSSETAEADAFAPLAQAAVWAPELRLGTAIVPVYTRGPAVLAMSFAALAQMAPGRFVAGIGASSPAIVEAWNGVPFERPWYRVRDTIRFLRAAMGGEKVSERYETFAVEGFRLGYVPAEPPPIYVAALREGMLRLAGREGDGAILNWLSAEDVRKVAPIVRETDPGKEIVARIFVAPSEDEEEVRAQASRFIAAYLSVPAYAAYQDWLGRGEALREMWDAWAAGDRKRAVAAVPQEIVDELFVFGSPASCREQIQAYVEAGVSTPVVMLMPWGIDQYEGLEALGRL